MGLSTHTMHRLLFIWACLVAGYLMLAASNLLADDDAILSVFSQSGVPAVGDFTFSQTSTVDLSGSNWGYGVDENDVYHAALSHSQVGSSANQQWELRIGQGGQIYSLISEVGEIVPPQSLGRPYVDEVFQAISVDTSPRDNGNDASFYHQSGYYTESNNVPLPFFSPLLASGGVDADSYSTLSLAVQADTTANPQQPSGLLNYQRTKDLGGGVIEVSHLIYNFGENRVNFHNLPWGGVRKTVFDNMLVSNPGGGFTDRAILEFGDSTTQVVLAEATGGWAAFSEGTAGSDRGLAYVFGDTDTHLNEDWQTGKSSWRWGDGGGDFLGIPIRNFNVGTFRRVVDVDPGDLFQSRYYLVLGDLDQIESTIAFRNLADSATYGKVILGEDDSEILGYDLVEDNGKISVVETTMGATFDFGTYASPVNGSTPLFLFEDDLGNEFISVDPYALSAAPYDGLTGYKGILGFVLPSDSFSNNGSYVDLTSLFSGGSYYLDTDPTQTIFAIQSSLVPEPLLGDVNLNGVVDFLDISPFIAVLSRGEFQTEADCDQNETVDFLDISSFVRILSGS